MVIHLVMACAYLWPNLGNKIIAVIRLPVVDQIKPSDLWVDRRENS